MKNILKSILLTFMLMQFHGCSTMYTVSTDASNPERMRTEACNEKCTIPRMYSGTAMDICGFTSEDSGQGGAIMFWDIFFSIPADTILLPYTTIMQLKNGNISSTDKCSR